VVDEATHMVDMYPTLAGLAGAPLGKNKPLDGLNVSPTISEGKISPRKEVVYDIEPFRAAVPEGDWNPQKAAELQQRIQVSARRRTCSSALSPCPTRRGTLNRSHEPRMRGKAPGPPMRCSSRQYRRQRTYPRRAVSKPTSSSARRP